jgi:serine/tyrosine/threonine adenylyltransferase
LKLENRPFEEIAEAMRRINPAYIPRNHRVEWAIKAAEKGDFSKAIELHAVLAKPFDDQPEFAAYQDPPKPGDWKCQTFCGT